MRRGRRFTVPSRRPGCWSRSSRRRGTETRRSRAVPQPQGVAARQRPRPGVSHLEGRSELTKGKGRGLLGHRQNRQNHAEPRAERGGPRASEPDGRPVTDETRPRVLSGLSGGVSATSFRTISSRRVSILSSYDEYCPGLLPHYFSHDLSPGGAAFGVFSRFLTLRQLSGPALPGRTVTGCVILRNSHVIRVAARRVRLTREIPAYTRRSTGPWRLRASPARVARTRQDGNKEIDYS